MGRLVSIVMTSAVSSLCLAQSAPVVDFLSVPIGKPFPVPSTFDAKSHQSPFLPDYTFTAPMPATSKLNLFKDYEVDAMKDNGNVYRLRAKRAYESTEACTQALKAVAAAVVPAYHLVPTKSEMSFVSASSPEIDAEAYCAYHGGSPYPLLTLSVSSKAESVRAMNETRKALEQMRKAPPR